MSLWTKPLDEIKYIDVEAFCLATPRPREGLRLDYKQAIPDDLARLISAFANTSGGMIIVSVKSDAKNEPEWPPIGLALKTGLLEQFTQISQQAIYPAVMIETSSFLEDSNDPGKGVIVVRVHESPGAPHAVDGGRRIYERTGDVNHPINYAHVDRIERLLTRRSQIAERRSELRDRFLSRAHRVLPKQVAITCWASVMPLYPGPPICDPAVCYKFLGGKPHATLQRTPDGAFAAYLSSSIGDLAGFLQCSSAGMFGDFCMAKFCDDEFHYRSAAARFGKDSNQRAMQLKEVLMFFVPTIHTGVSFLRTTLGYQGYIQVSIGMLECERVQLVPLQSMRDVSPHPFLDSEFSDDETILPGNMSSADDIRPLFTRFLHAFDLAPQDCETFLSFRG